MVTWYNDFNLVSVALQTKGARLVAWPYLGCSYGVTWAVFAPRALQ